MSVDMSAFTSLSQLHRQMKVPMLYRNETSAAVKLLNCVLFGISQCTIEMQFNGSRGNTTPYSGEMHAQMWAVTRDVLRTLKSMPDEAKSWWTPILYFWEPVQGYATHESEFSQLVFADATLSRFLIVEVRDRTICPCCDKPETILYDEYLRFSAQRLLNVITYLPLPNKPNSVRATYKTNENPVVPPAFYNFSSGTILSDSEAAIPKPSILHLTPQDLVPMFTPGDLVALDCTTLRKDEQVPSKEIRDLVCVKKGEEWTTRWSTANKVVGKADPMIRTLCLGCGKYDTANTRLRCTACRMVFYCSAECQRTHWPEHKHECMPKKKA
ncbi:hypothetical protein NBRC10513v2_006093 [Rhodotorula toruloides]|uniref:FGENESH: predicted gene_6.490 protein n=1 Tax=Rhodotorula toruloides TaxID=5286 RepID=A0A0K3CGI6_RHOTO|nr:hypothetical protein AAT19DRAFT_15040 [Rhodotorula toruloides]